MRLALHAIFLETQRSVLHVSAGKHLMKFNFDIAATLWSYNFSGLETQHFPKYSPNHVKA